MKNLLLFFLLITNISFSQNYTTAIGIKGGYPGFGTLNAKHFIGNQTALEASIGGFANGGSSGAFVMLDYELNSELDPGFSWYYGGGALVGFTSTSEDRPNLNIGINGILGIEYTFSEVPINCSLDTGPFVFLIPRVSFAWGGGLAIRYAIR
jgi:hypothetical protein